MLNAGVARNTTVARAAVPTLAAIAPQPKLAMVPRTDDVRRGSVSAGPSCPAGMGEPMQVRLGAGRSTLLNLPERVVRRTLGDPEIVDSQLVSPQVLYLAAGRIGSTNAILQGQSGRCTALSILVGLDVDAVSSKLAELLPAEKGIVVTSAADSLVLSGQVSNPVVAEQAVEIANAYVRSAYQQGVVHPGASGGQGGNTAGRALADAGGAPLLARVVNLLGVAAPMQVMLEVKVAEVSKTVLDQFGINFSRAYALGDGSAIRFLNGLLGGQGLVAGGVSGTVGAMVGGGSINSATNGSATGGITAPNGTATIGGGSTTIPMIAGQNSTLIGVDAKKQDGLVKVLAEPTVMAISGQEGSFLAGGKILVPIAQNNGGVLTYTLEEKEFGVSLRFRPTVLADNRINLQVNPEVSELASNGVTLTSSATGATAILPAFSTRKAATTVQLRDGQSFAIGGLMKANATANVNAFPILGELPIIGALFRSTSFQTDRSELVFVVTPRLVKPLPPDYQLPTDRFVEPSRSEVMFEGKLEGTRQNPPATGGSTTGVAGFELK